MNIQGNPSIFECQHILLLQLFLNGDDVTKASRLLKGHIFKASGSVVDMQKLVTSFIFYISCPYFIVIGHIKILRSI